MSRQNRRAKRPAKKRTKRKMPERNGAFYGLRLPGVEIAPARGESHASACLQALALYQPS